MLPDGSQRTVDNASLLASIDVHSRQYTVRPGDVETFSGVSVRHLLRDVAGVDMTGVTFARARHDDGTTDVLTTADLAGPPDFPDGPALVFADGPSIRYLRPPRDDSDPKGADDYATQSGESLTIELHDGAVLAVHASASTTSAKPGAAVTLSATASGAELGETLAFSWTLGDGDLGAGSTVVHRFAAPGTYRIVVDVRGSAGSAGTSTPVVVVVGAAPTGTSTEPGGTPPPPGTQAPTVTPPPTHAGTPVPAPTTTTRPAPTPTATTPQPTTPAPAASPAPAAAPPAPTPAPAAGPATTPSPTPTPTATPSPAATGGARVSGILLAEGAPLAPASAAPPSARPHTPAVPPKASSHGFGLGLPRPNGLELALGLVLLGAVRERRTLRRALG